MQWSGAIGTCGENRNASRDLVGKYAGRIARGRPRRRWEDNIKTDIKGIK
jgi:hypothetical protein